MGGTDCALPMIHAKQKKLEVDVFIVYTDSETWYGKIHPTEALKQYRKVRNSQSISLFIPPFCSRLQVLMPNS